MPVLKGILHDEGAVVDISVGWSATGARQERAALRLHDASVIVLHPSGRARGNLSVLDLTVVELDLAALGYEALLGRDLLARCRFLYDGPKSSFQLRY
jgi:hypothetical protein